MFSFLRNAPAPRPDHAACSGCSLCLLVCPVWRATRDLRLTPHGRAKALQHGASVEDISSSVESCTLCAACEPVCPENIALVDMMLALRAQLPPPAAHDAIRKRADAVGTSSPSPGSRAARMLVADPTLVDHPEALARVASLLECACADDNGADIALAMEAGVPVPPSRLERFLGPLRGVREVFVGDGLLLRLLRNTLSKQCIIGTGEALSGLPSVRRQLRAGDLYVIETRAYHADHARLVTYYDRLRADTGCDVNLDLLRMAIPATARNLPQRLGLQAVDDTEHARWLLHGRNVARIVVESMDDAGALTAAGATPVIHVADLACTATTRQAN